jgi:hypothetical protein
MRLFLYGRTAYHDDHGGERFEREGGYQSFGVSSKDPLKRIAITRMACTRMA